MATRPKQPPPPGVSDPDDETGQTWGVPVNQSSATLTETDTPETAEDSVVDRIKALVATNGGESVRIKLYRRDPKKPGLEWCDDYTVAEFESGELAMIRDKWGPGQYEVRLIGSRGVLSRVSVNIAAEKMLQFQQQPQQQPQQSSELAQIFGQLMQQNQRIIEAIQTRPDPMTQMQPLIAMMVQLRELTAPAAAPPKNQLSEIVAAMREMREVAAEFTPQEPKEPESLLALAPQMLSLIQTGMQQRSTPLTAAQAGYNMTPLQEFPTITTPPTMQPPENSPSTTLVQVLGQNHNPTTEPALIDGASKEQMEAIELLRGHLRELLKAANNPQQFIPACETLYEQLPDDAFPLLESPEWFKGLCMFEPQCAAHEQWLTHVRAQLLAWLAEDGADDGAATGQDDAQQGGAASQVVTP